MPIQVLNRNIHKQMTYIIKSRSFHLQCIVHAEKKDASEMSIFDGYLEKLISNKYLTTPVSSPTEKETLNDFKNEIKSKLSLGPKEIENLDMKSHNDFNIQLCHSLYYKNTNQRKEFKKKAALKIYTILGRFKAKWKPIFATSTDSTSESVIEDHKGNEDEDVNKKEMVHQLLLEQHDQLDEFQAIVNKRTETLEKRRIKQQKKVIKALLEMEEKTLDKKKGMTLKKPKKKPKHKITIEKNETDDSEDEDVITKGKTKVYVYPIMPENEIK